MTPYTVAITLLLLALCHCEKRASPSGPDSAAEEAVTRNLLLLTGFNSDNIVSYDPAARVAQEVLRFRAITRPRGVGQSRLGDLFVATRQGDRNVLRSTWREGELDIVDFTEPIGRYGPAEIYVDDEDAVFVAGDTTQEVRVYRPDGALSHTYSGGTLRGNVCGFAIHETGLFTAHLFRGTIAKHAMASDVPIDSYKLDPAVMKNPYSVLVAHNGNVLVGGTKGCGKVLELDPASGEILGVFVDLEDEGLFGVGAMIYLEDRRTYFFASRSGLLEYDEGGRLLERHPVDIIDKVSAICIARNPAAVDRIAAQADSWQTN